MELLVYEDCMSLLQSFVKSGDFSFKSFSAQWCKLLFTHIWSMQNTYIEVMQTTSAALHVAKRVACGKRTNGQPVKLNQTQVDHGYRIGGIYLMYAIYFKQPTEKFVTIEVSPDTWQELEIFIDMLDESSSAVAADVCYIFRKLVQDGAFSFTAHDFHLGIENLIDYDKPPTKITQTSCGQKDAKTCLKDDLPIVSNIAATLPALTELEQHYNEMKRQLSGADGANAQALPATSIVKDLQNAFNNIALLLEDVQTVNDKTNITPTETDKTIRRSLKRKAFLTDFNEIEKASIPYHEEELNYSSTPSVDRPQSALRVDRRQSARTVFAHQLPNEISEEVDKKVSETNSVRDEVMHATLHTDKYKHNSLPTI